MICRRQMIYVHCRFMQKGSTMDQKTTRMRESASIDLFDLLKRVMIEWRAVLVLSLLAGCLLYVVIGALEARKANRQEVQLEQQEEARNASTEESLRASLDEEDLNAVLLAVKEDQMINDRVKYMTNSLQQEIATDSFKTLYILLRFEPKALKGTFLKRYFWSYFQSSEFVNLVAAAEGESVEEAYASELISLDTMIPTQEEKTGEETVMAIAIAMLDGCDADKLTDTVEKAITQYSKQMQEKLGDFSCVIDTIDVRTRYEQTFAGRKRDLLYEIYNLRAQLKATTDTFSSNQRMLYEKLTGELSEEELTTVSASTTKGYGKKAFAAGVILVVFLYICFAMLLALIQSRINSRTELTGINDFGEVRNYRASNIPDAFIRSKFVYRMLYGRYASDRDPVALAGLAAKLRQLETVTILHTDIETDLMKQVAEDLNNMLSEQGVRTNQIRMIGKNDLDPEAIASFENLILLVNAGKTKYKDVKELVSICDLCNEEILGYILCGE